MGWKIFGVAFYWGSLIAIGYNYGWKLSAFIMTFSFGQTALKSIQEAERDTLIYNILYSMKGDK